MTSFVVFVNKHRPVTKNPVESFSRFEMVNTSITPVIFYENKIYGNLIISN